MCVCVCECSQLEGALSQWTSYQDDVRQFMGWMEAVEVALGSTDKQYSEMRDKTANLGRAKVTFLTAPVLLSSLPLSPMPLSLPPLAHPYCPYPYCPILILLLVSSLLPRPQCPVPLFSDPVLMSSQCHAHLPHCPCPLSFRLTWVL